METLNGFSDPKKPAITIFQSDDLQSHSYRYPISYKYAKKGKIGLNDPPLDKIKMQVS